VIAADGNGISDLSAKHRDSSQTEDFFEREANGECFFHSTRTMVRRALINALKKTFDPIVPKNSLNPDFQLPFRLLMVGGDDMLLLCDAAFGPEFLVQYASSLGELASQRVPELSIGAGMAIVKRTFPFHRAHALVEDLVSSAKQLFRSMRSKPQSTVDWLSISESWFEDLRGVRSRDYCRSYRVGSIPEEKLILSAKPYAITGSTNGSLEGLWNLARKSTEDQQEIPRSQLRALGESLAKGKRQAEQARQAMPETLDPILNRLCGDSIWQDCGNHTYMTRVLDFLELYELARLRQSQLDKLRKAEEPAV
jgi:hypothetical protein